MDHNLLLFKLELLGFNKFVTQLLVSYLRDRTQYVNISGVISRSIEVTSGVQQGSHIGPLLFLIFINDLCSLLHDVDFLLYADDLKLYRSVNCFDDYLLLQDNVDIIGCWCGQYGMSLSVKKCNIVSFSRKPPCKYVYQSDEMPIARSTIVKDLGIWLDSHLDFKKHVDITCAKAKSVWSIVKRFGKEFKDPYTLKHLYMSLVLPIVEYGSVVWMPFYDVDVSRIESLQKQFLLFCLRDLGWSDGFRLPPYRRRLNLLNMLTLRDRQKLACCVFTFDVLCGNINCASLSDQFVVREQSYGLVVVCYVSR